MIVGRGNWEEVNDSVYIFLGTYWVIQKWSVWGTNLFKKHSLYISEISELKYILERVNKRTILFLDEPTLGLDINAQRNLRQFLQKYNYENNATICLTSHYMKDIKNY